MTLLFCVFQGSWWCRWSSCCRASAFVKVKTNFGSTAAFCSKAASGAWWSKKEAHCLLTRKIKGAGPHLPCHVLCAWCWHQRGTGWEACHSTCWNPWVHTHPSVPGWSQLHQKPGRGPLTCARRLLKQLSRQLSYRRQHTSLWMMDWHRKLLRPSPWRWVGFA